jgi:hypothetical protein
MIAVQFGWHWDRNSGVPAPYGMNSGFFHTGLWRCQYCPPISRPKPMPRRQAPVLSDFLAAARDRIRSEAGVGLAIGSVSDYHMETFRVTDRGRVEHRWFPEDSGNGRWSEWEDFWFEHGARDVAVTSARPHHLEGFILANDGMVWHRWWWGDAGWNREGFETLGRPFPNHAHAIACTSLRAGHIEVQVRAEYPAIRNLWYDDGWRFADDQRGWWDF